MFVGVEGILVRKTNIQRGSRGGVRPEYDGKEFKNLSGRLVRQFRLRNEFGTAVERADQSWQRRWCGKNSLNPGQLCCDGNLLVLWGMFR